MTSKTSDVGFLLIHGFSGTHHEMSPLENLLKNKKFIVKNITLPGHETSIEDLDSKNFADWISYSQDKLNELQDKCESVFIAGLSLGGVLTLILAAKNKAVKGIITMAAPYEFPKWRMKLFMNPISMFFFKRMMKEEDAWEDLEAFKTHQSYNEFPKKGFDQAIKLIEEVKKSVPLITCPTLTIYASKDKTVPYQTALKLNEDIQSKNKTIVEIIKGGHVIPEDAGRYQLFEEVEKWLSNEFNL